MSSFECYFEKHLRLIELHGDAAAGVENSEWPTDAAVIEDSDADISIDSDTDALDKHDKNLITSMRKDIRANIWLCTLCEYSSKRKFNVSEHVKAKHIQHEGYDCHLCDETCPSPSALRMHKKRKHNE